MDGTEFVNVAIRIRPEHSVKENTPCLQIISEHPPVLLMPERTQTFNFDQIFGPEVNQDVIYQQTVQSLVKHVKQGYNCTVFAYGQTGTGKTYTIGTDPHITDEVCLGLIPRALNDFFEDSYNVDAEVEVFVSFIEIYNERVFDLLQCSRNPQLFVKGMRPQGYCQEKVFNLTEARHFLNLGSKNRHTAGTKQNANSSRSHAIFTIYCNCINKGKETKAKLNLVDLAGCESVRKTGNQGSTFHEGVNINKGLLSISQVMMALSTNSSFIPYRQSVITSVLQDSLNKQNFISLIACVSSLQEDGTETAQTLDFAQRIKKVKSRPEINQVIAQYKKDNPYLFSWNKSGTTPFKRPFAQNYQTPASAKRLKPVETLSELSTISSEPSTCARSLFSLSTASTASNQQADITSQVLSPVIKKYITAMEVSLIDKLEIMIKSSLKRQSRELEYESKHSNENEGCTPHNWSKFQNEVSKIVKSEIAQFSIKQAQATSSPLDTEELDRVRKVLKYSSPVGEDGITVIEKCNQKFKFKIPEMPVIKKQDVKRRILSISPIENIPVNPRRSARLSLRNTNTSAKLEVSENNCLRISLNDSSFSPDIFVNVDTPKNPEPVNHTDTSKRISTRQSVRLADKMNKTKIDDEKENNQPVKISLKKRTEKVTGKNTNLTIANTVGGKRLIKKNGIDSPCTSHTKRVLNILNHGNLKEIEQLQTIGKKTAQQVVLLRKLKGSLKKISDMSQLAGWGDRKFEQFVVQNFLKRELL